MDANGNTDNNIDGSTATVTDDYTIDPATVTLTINAGQTTVTAEVELTVVDNNTAESNQTIVLWDSDGGAVVGSSDTPTVQPVTITIIDDDGS